MRAWLELARLSNLPTLVTNVLVGAAIGGLGAAIAWPAVCAVGSAVILFYVGGMAMNDVVDRDIDRQHRPGRPIPSGRITVRGAALFAVACLATGVGLAALAGPPALLLSLLLVAAIVIYNRFHKATAVSVVLMGVCRGLVYVMAAATAWPPDQIVTTTLAGAITAYIALVSVVARVETGTTLDGRRWTGLALVAVAAAPIAVIRPDSWTWTIVAAIVVTAWLLAVSRHALARPPRIRLAVPGWLAGICLLDGLYLTLLAEPGLGGVALGCFVVTTVAHRRILGT